MRRTLLLLAMLLWLAAVCGPMVAAPALTPAPQVNETRDTAGLFGLNGVGFFHYRDAPDAAQTAQRKMEFLQKAGATWDRFDFWWSEMEPQRGTWKWDKADWLVDFYARHGVNMLPILSYRAAWMTAPPHTSEDDAEFADYVRHVVHRYKGRIHAWEIWNEPNIPTFWNPPSAPDYTAMLKAAYAAAHQEDPHCVIVGASANETDLNWIRDIAKNGGLGSMDAVSVHPYSMADGPEQMDLTRQLEDVHTLLASLGRPALRVWITEMGWTSNITDAAANSRVRANMAQSYVIAASQHVPHLFWFSEQDWTEGGKLQGWGLLSPEDQVKPALHTYRWLADTLGASRFVGCVPVTRGEGYVFERHGARTLFLWNHRGQRSILFVGARARVTSADGQAVPIAAGYIGLTEMPMAVEHADRTLLARVTPIRPAPETDNLVVNGALSEVDAHGSPYGWHRGVFYGGADKGTFDVTAEAGGGHALSLAQTGDALWESWPVPAMPGEHYTLTAQIKAMDATGNNGVQILFLSGPGWGWRGGPTSATVTGTGDWKTVTVTGTVPDDADVVRVNLVSKKNAGTVLFRGITLTRQATPRPNNGEPE